MNSGPEQFNLFPPEQGGKQSADQGSGNTEDAPPSDEEEAGRIELPRPEVEDIFGFDKVDEDQYLGLKKKVEEGCKKELSGDVFVFSYAFVLGVVNAYNDYLDKDCPREEAESKRIRLVSKKIRDQRGSDRLVLDACRLVLKMVDSVVEEGIKIKIHDNVGKYFHNQRMLPRKRSDRLALSRDLHAEDEKKDRNWHPR